MLKLIIFVWILLLKGKNTYAFIIGKKSTKWHLSCMCHSRENDHVSRIDHYRFKSSNKKQNFKGRIRLYELKEVELADVLRRLKLILRHHQHLEWWFFLAIQHDSPLCCWRANSILIIHKQVKYGIYSANWWY